MIGLASCRIGSVRSIDYILKDKGQAIEIDRNLLSGGNGKEILSEFRFIQELNQNCENNTISLVISPSPEDSQKMDIKEFQKIAIQHLKNLNLINNHWIATLHPSTGKPHIHIIANRIDKYGTALNDSFIGIRAQKSAEKIALENGYTLAKDVRMEEIKLKKDLNKNIIAEIKTAHFNVLKTGVKDLNEYCIGMKSLGKVPEFIKNKQGNIQGIKFEHLATRNIFKASEVSKFIRYEKLIANLAMNISRKLINQSKGISR